MQCCGSTALVSLQISGFGPAKAFVRGGIPMVHLRSCKHTSGEMPMKHAFLTEEIHQSVWLGLLKISGCFCPSIAHEVVKTMQEDVCWLSLLFFTLVVPMMQLVD